MLFVCKKRKGRKKVLKPLVVFCSVSVVCIFIPGLLPFTRRVALCAFNNFPEIFVADYYYFFASAA
jgi:hypothetical protein